MVAVAVAWTPPTGGCAISIVGTNSYAYLGSMISILSTTFVTFSGKSSVISCGSCLISDLTNLSSILWSFSVSPKSPTLSAHSSKMFTFPDITALLLAIRPKLSEVPFPWIIPL